MKVMTILGTRPEIIRLSLVIKKLDKYVDHVLVHTGQNFTASLSDIFFEQLNLRKPDYVLINKQQTLGEQLAIMYKRLEEIFIDEKPDKVVVLGDTNSGLSALLAERMGIRVVHMEAGNRCFDLEVPEELNRRVIDTISTFNLPYTQRSKENLLREGVPINRIFISGNPIYEVIKYYEKEIEQSRIASKLHLNNEDYFLLTVHRAENVDNKNSLAEIIKGMNFVADSFNKRIICSIHPRTKSRIEEMHSINIHPLVEFHEPFGFFDFIKLEKNAYCVITDSGTVQEECCIFRIPTVTIRKTTERPETIECGSNMLSGINASQIVSAVQIMVNQPKNWLLPNGYEEKDVSDKVAKIILGGFHGV
ncbi:non-hydrolyzing UDP-N-acetylglucosamine 2-epimerase [Evansella sp. AB-rgal1]|uniref:non-hydrolyzing UDP-N-acetylglucosamine 2-epimerase n=1 Tax=Evansella sp. AB-rgal1 TaxID=3242696 RepID=UPI00359EDB52